MPENAAIKEGDILICGIYPGIQFRATYQRNQLKMKFNGGEDHGKTVWKCKDYRDLLEGKSAWLLVTSGEIFDGETGP